MENTKIDLYKESLSAKVNRMEQTIKEVKALYSYKQEEIDTLQDYILEIKQNETKQKIEVRSLNEEIKTITQESQTIINSLVDQVDYWKSLALALNKK